LPEQPETGNVRSPFFRSEADHLLRPSSRRNQPFGFMSKLRHWTNGLHCRVPPVDGIGGRVSVGLGGRLCIIMGGWFEHHTHCVAAQSPCPDARFPPSRLPGKGSKLRHRPVSVVSALGPNPAAGVPTRSVRLACRTSSATRGNERHRAFYRGGDERPAPIHAVRGEPYLLSIPDFASASPHSFCPGGDVLFRLCCWANRRRVEFR